jgi:hypothetical protein
MIEPPSEAASGDIVLVLGHDRPFEAVDGYLRRCGWRPADAGAPVTPPLVAGQPELTTWRLGSAVATLEFNPIVELGVLRICGIDATTAAGLAGAIPHCSVADVAALLRCGRDDDVARGLFAAEALDDPQLAPWITRLTGHPRPFIATLAGRVLAVLGGRTP